MITIASWFMATGWAGNPLLRELEVTPKNYRASYDVTLFVRRDGNLFLEDNLVIDTDLPREVQRIAAQRGSDARIVVSAAAGADYARVVEVLDLVQEAGVARVALEIGEAIPANDPLFPGSGEIENLDEKGFDGDFEDYKPKRHKFPQNPYGSTDFTAYTREWGEAKIGLAFATYGVLPRVHIGTAPLLDFIGVFNLQAKGNFLRLGPWDAALTGTVSVIPITNILRAIDPDGQYNIAGYKVQDNEIFVNRMTYVAFQLQNSFQLYKGWSFHTTIGYSRATARGTLDFYNLPVIALPGLDQLGGEVAVVPSAVGELVDVRLATDYRFNRRDSLILQVAQSVYGSARGTFTPNIEELPRQVKGVNNLDFVVRYDGAIPWYQTIRGSIAWQFSWQRVDLRVGWGISAVPWTWLLQAVDLSYPLRGIDAAQGSEDPQELQAGPEGVRGHRRSAGRDTAARRPAAGAAADRSRGRSAPPSIPTATLPRPSGSFPIGTLPIRSPPTGSSPTGSSPDRFVPGRYAPDPLVPDDPPLKDARPEGTPAEKASPEGGTPPETPR